MQGIATLGYQPLTGIQASPAMYNAAKILADMGREEDTYIVHAAEGETVIPMEVMEANPKMAEMVYAQLREMGLEPERYIVGNELNSINPATGMPEFFLKKLFKGIKKVAKVVLPIIATVALASVGVPVPIANGIVRGTNTIIQGGSFGDGLKSAARGFVEGAVVQGVASAVTAPPGTSLGDRVSTGFDSATRSFTQPLTAQPEAFTGSASSAAPTTPSPSATGQFTSQELVDFANSPLGEAAIAANPTIAPVDATGTALQSGNFTLADAPSLQSTAMATGYEPVSAAAGAPLANPDLATARDTFAAATEPSFGERVSDFYDERISPSRTSAAGKGALVQYAPIAGIGALATEAMGGFDTEPLMLEDVEGEFATTGEDLLAMQPEKYGYNFSDFVGSNPYFQPQAPSGIGTMAQPAYASPVVATPTRSLMTDPVLDNTPMAMALGAAGGGAIYGPGTETSDSIPALLSDGEFVFNAKSVRGAGGGDRIKGARNMYRAMKQLEAMA